MERSNLYIAYGVSFNPYSRIAIPIEPNQNSIALVSTILRFLLKQFSPLTIDGNNIELSRLRKEFDKELNRATAVISNTMEEYLLLADAILELNALAIKTPTMQYAIRSLTKHKAIVNIQDQY